MRPFPIRNRRTAFIFAAFVSLALTQPPGVLAQSNQKSSTQQLAKPPQPVDQEQFISYWTTEPGWNTELHLRNNLESSDLTVAPALRTAAGVETALPSVTIKAGEVVSLDLYDVLMKAAPQLAGGWGSVVVRFNAITPSALYASVMVRAAGRPFDFHLDGFGRGSKYETGSREGIWWLPQGSVTDYLILTNSGDQVLEPNLVLYDSIGKAWQQKLNLSARQTLRLSIRSLLQQAGFSGSFGGIKIDMAKGARYLDSAHLLFDESGGFSAIMKMFKHDPSTTLSSRSFGGVKEWTTRAPMLALSNPDPALGFPAGTALQPKVFIRNATGKTFTAHIRFNWRSATTSGKSAPLDLTFNANETSVIAVAALQAQKLLPADAQWAAVILSASVLPEELLAVAASYDQTGRYGTQTPFSDQLASHWEGGKWEVDRTHNSLVTIANGGNTPAQAQLTILYNQGSGQYLIEQTLAPDEQMGIDFGKLIHNQVPDKNGHTLPPDLTWGAYRLRDLNDNPLGSVYEGKVIVDKTYGHAAYGCMICCGPNNPWMVYAPLTLTVNGSANQAVQAINSCTQHIVTVTGDFPTWWTGNTSIATAANTQINGMAAGTTDHDAQSINMYWGPRADSGGGDCPLSQEAPSASTNVFSGVLTPQNNFSGRSTTRYGIAEVINLSFHAQVTAAALGGLQWSIVSGGGGLTGAGTDGMGTYTAPGNQATVVLRLAVVSGSGQYHDYSISIIPPNGGLESRFSNLRHTQGYESVGFEAHIYLEPTDVSFANLQFAEGTDTATASGFFAASNGQVHPPTNPPVSIGQCDSVIGCEVNGTDTIDSGNNPPPFSVGDFLWQIPWQYKSSTGSLTAFTIVNHHETADATGKGTIEKGGAGPFSKNASDPTSSY
jgi:hypothetical protein